MKPEFVKYLHADSILVLEGETKKAVLEEIITYATTRCTMDEAQLREAIWKREKMMTTGIGNGLALPHIRVAEFPSPLVIVGICQTPILFAKSRNLTGKLFSLPPMKKIRRHISSFSEASPSS